MIAPAQPDLVTVNIDGKEIAVPRGTNVIEAARLVAIDVPHYCYHPKLSVVGNCRMCLIEMGLPAVDPATKAPIMDPASGKQKINWMPRPQIGCATNVSPGLHVRTTTPQIKDCREGVMEFLLINHPLDCPICDQAGECKLQEQATQYGRGYSRFVEQKNVKPKRTPLGPRVMLDDERCILCSRCIRFCKEVAKDDVLGFIDRGSFSTLTCYPGKQLENNYSLNTVDICPVGALTSTDFRFKMRVWFLKQTNSIDTESSVGANTVVWSREGVIYRITPRRNDAVNDTWMADSGRLLYKQVAAPDRLSAITVQGAAGTLASAAAAASTLFQAGAVAVVGSGRSTVEEQFLTKQLAATLGARVSLVSRVGQGDKILISADRNPNLRGALVTGLIDTLPSAQLAALGAAIEAGQVKTVVAIGEDLAAAGLTAAQLAKVSIVYLGTHANATSVAAKIVVPTLTVFEKAGTFINQQFRIQKFARAVPGPAGASDDLAALSALIAAAGGAAIAADLPAIWAQLAAEVPALATMTYRNIPDTGLLLDGTPWSALPFVEGETLHYKPAAAPALATA
ncbi:(2Fe-2S)-binding protein [Horticoccus luteus]|uniref:(2Fe-2S)-binding protein n=1 Tax=Horticoccus luteus TaxID=2862869 RepID=A0A8F9XKK6_9BACT|nr:2Fe-2S iron-sulfur cluster-binding protein [Horticoccus luteus]QYM78296.1 (2Fe-2S)-binding protein [Horticoccus luteus]